MKATLLILFASMSGYFAWAAAPTCSGVGPDCILTTGNNGCRVGVHSCCITQDGVTYKIINSTGSVLFVPAKAGNGDWAAFYGHLPTNVTKSAVCP